MLDEFLFFFINIHHVKFCFATNVWLRNSVVSTVLIFRRNLYNLKRCFYGKLSTFLMVNELTKQCFANRQMDARGKIGEHERSVRVLTLAF